MSTAALMMETASFIRVSALACGDVVEMAAKSSSVIAATVTPPPAVSDQVFAVASRSSDRASDLFGVLFSSVVMGLSLATA